MIKELLLVGAGSAIGGIGRYGIGALALNYWKHPFPLATFIINTLGSLLIGCLAARLITPEAGTAEEAQRLFWMAGICGGFTTFSSFSLETFNLMRSGHTGLAALYAVLSVVICVAGTASGYALCRS
jgi:CrcB protein